MLRGLWVRGQVALNRGADSVGGAAFGRACGSSFSSAQEMPAPGRGGCRRSQGDGQKRSDSHSLFAGKCLVTYSDTSSSTSLIVCLASKQACVRPVCG